MKKLISVTALVIILTVSAFAQPADVLIREGKNILYQAHIHFDKALFFKARGLFERALASDSGNYLAKYYLVYTDYNLTTLFIRETEKHKSNRYMKAAIKMCEELLDEKEDDAETKALLGSLYGFQISLEPELGRTLGPQIGAMFGEALFTAPDNPRVLLLAGINKLYTPETFGGSKSEALKYFQKSVKIFESDSTQKINGIDWGYLDALAWEGKTYYELGDYASAVEVFKKALKVEPEFGWVKHKLLPEAEAKLNSIDKKGFD